MRLRHNLGVLLLAGIIAFAPSLAEARAGGSARSGGGTVYQSQGSRGSQTYTPNGGQSVQRSTTQPSTTSSSAYGYGYGGSFWNRHPFLTAIAGGFFGAWIGSWLFPSLGFGGMVGGSIISWLLIIMIAMFVVRAFRRSAFATVGPPMGGFYGSGPSYSPTPVASAPASAGLVITQQDHADFEALLKSIQAAWSVGDLTALRRYVTPEMLSYFSEALANNTSQGVENRVEQVTLLNGDVRESWDEGALQYATALLRWSALDYNVRAGANSSEPGYVVEGNADRTVEAQEMWTFVRGHGGHWVLSAIQQV